MITASKWSILPPLVTYILPDAVAVKFITLGVVIDPVSLAYPLYVDSLPAPVTEALERIAVYRPVTGRANGQRLVAVANCGFPEAEHNRAPLSICQQFARQAGFDWAGQSY
jgi:hypothetical protein